MMNKHEALHIPPKILVYKILKRNGERMFSLDQTRVFLLPEHNAQLQDIGNTISGKANAERRESNFKLQKISKEFLLKRNHNKVPPC